MFKLRVSQYINKGLVDHDMTYKVLSERSGVPMSTIHSYAQGKTGNPNEDNLNRIAAAFGDGPDVIQAMRRKSLESTATENMLFAKSEDAEAVEKYAALIRSNVAQILEEYRIQAADQQTEIIQSAEKRVEDAKREASEKCQQVLNQCLDHEREYKKHCDAIIDAERRATIAEKKGHEEVIARLERNIVYLRSIVRNVSLVAALFAAYTLYAYKTFDIEDPERGLYRGGRTDIPLIILALVLSYAFFSMFKNFFVKKFFKTKK